jgi:hypothetical protein
MRLPIEKDIILINKKIDAAIAVLFEICELMPGFVASDAKARETISSFYVKKLKNIPVEDIQTKQDGKALFDIQFFQNAIDELHYKINEVNLKVDGFVGIIGALDDKRWQD